MIESKSLAKTAALCAFLDPTTAFRWRHLFLRAPKRQAPGALEELSKRTKPSFSNCSRPTSDLPRKARRRGGTARHPGLHQDNIPILVARDRNGATFDAILAQVDGASVSLALAGIVTRQSSHRR